MPAGQPGADTREYPDKLDAELLRISGVCILATVMAILDVTVVSVAQRTFIDQFASSQAVVAWTMTGYTLALATVIPITGWAADRFGTNGSSWAPCWPSCSDHCCARLPQTSCSSSSFGWFRVSAAACCCRWGS